MDQSTKVGIAFLSGGLIIGAIAGAVAGRTFTKATGGRPVTCGSKPVMISPASAAAPHNALPDQFDVCLSSNDTVTWKKTGVDDFKIHFLDGISPFVNGADFQPGANRDEINSGSLLQNAIPPGSEHYYYKYSVQVLLKNGNWTDPVEPGGIVFK